jgi:hypothetical protein
MLGAAEDQAFDGAVDGEEFGDGDPAAEAGVAALRAAGRLPEKRPAPARSPVQREFGDQRRRRLGLPPASRAQLPH